MASAAPDAVSQDSTGGLRFPSLPGFHAGRGPLRGCGWEVIMAGRRGGTRASFIQPDHPGKPPEE